jgi:5-formyltetrahydrofolate cyclo-ligase
VASALFKESQHIACYFATESEFDTTPIINAIWRAGKNCYLPCLANDARNIINFATYREDDILVKNRYLIMEPFGTEIIPAENLDVILLPLTGFDLHGHRLGSGGGYYDRTLATLSQPHQKPYFFGLGFQLQQVQELPHDHWDISLDGVLTEEKLFQF